MELKIDINETVVEWLASMGYPVSGMPVQMLRGMLLREARQWKLPPERLETMILEDARRAGHGEVEFGPAYFNVQPLVRSRELVASMPH